jgi:RNA polymerase sigma-70 factor (ECF subfamily)
MVDDVEATLSRLVAEQAFDRVAKLALETYGSELYGFLVNVIGGRAEASDVFSQAIENFWRGLPGFAGRCSMRTWLYVLAQNAAVSYRRSPWNGARRTGDSQLDTLIASARSRTAPWQRTDVKDKWHALREALDPEDRSLLVLRVDRDLAWSDVARVTLGSAQPGAAELARETARLRKRFQLLVQQLRASAREAGLVEDPT